MASLNYALVFFSSIREYTKRESSLFFYLLANGPALRGSLNANRAWKLLLSGMSTWKKAKQRRAERKMGDEGTGRVQHSKRELKRRHSNKDEQSVHPISDDSKIKDKWKGTHEIWKKKKSHMQLASASVCVSMLSYVLLDRVHSPWIFGHAGQLVCA